MSDFFTYSTGEQPGPLWPVHHIDKEQLIRAKEVNDENFWSELREIFKIDALTLPLSRFRVWASSMIVPIVSTTMYAKYMELVFKDPFALALARDENIVGCSQKDYEQFFRVFPDFPTTVNRMQAIAHLQLGDKLDGIVSNKYKKILEIGAGIGEMGVVCRDAGFTGEYQIFDFPELHTIQKYHHEKRGLEGFKYIENVVDLEDVDLVIATWSLTEMPMDLRSEVMQKIGGSKEWLVAYGTKIFGFDNDAWMNETFKEGYFFDADWHSNDGGTKYYVQ